ncbi:hypothetical protein DFH94DRAFT_11799 [Russula ochroleuca]|uniref:Uncharacterized protein n=1 Tax=Russula ochroleuca TaxID=152965 RepID=A0A9P5TE52_9AGAM|nr:hypothetical protein DFH94DRAFT_11799 [Russula ochroleuca]
MVSYLMTMLPAGVPFPSSYDKDNVPVTRDEKRIRRNALIDAAKNSFRRPFLQRGFSSSSSSTASQSPPHVSLAVLTNPARNQTHSVPHEEDSSTAYRSSSPPPPHAYIIISNPARTYSSLSIQDTLSSSSSVRQFRSSPHITIFSNPEREKQRAMPRSTQSTQSEQKDVSAAVPASMRVPTTTPISILKAPVPAPQPPTPAADIKLSKPALDSKEQNVIVNVLLPRIVVHESESCEAMAKTDVHYPGTGTDWTNHGEMPGAPVVNSRSRLRQNYFARRYYPMELAAEKVVRRLGLMVRSGSRVATARRREHPRQYNQTATATATATTAAALIVSRARAFMRAHTSTPSSTQPPHYPSFQ